MPKKYNSFFPYNVKRTTWGQNIAKSANYLFGGLTRESCENFIERDEKRMENIGYKFSGNDGVRDIHGFKDYCHYDIEG